jgi:hypothetical protein
MPLLSITHLCNLTCCMQLRARQQLHSPTPQSRHQSNDASICHTAGAGTGRVQVFALPHTRALTSLFFFSASFLYHLDAFYFGGTVCSGMNCSCLFTVPLPRDSSISNSSGGDASLAIADPQRLVCSTTDPQFPSQPAVRPPAHLYLHLHTHTPPPGPSSLLLLHPRRRPQRPHRLCLLLHRRIHSVTRPITRRCR